MVIDIIVRIMNFVSCASFVVENAVISVIDFVLDHNKGLEEALYRRAFDKLNKGE